MGVTDPHGFSGYRTRVSGGMHCIQVVQAIHPGFEPQSRPDPRFPIEGAPTLQGAPTYDFAKISEKLHEFEKFSGCGGVCRLRPLNLSMQMSPEDQNKGY